MEVVQKNAIGVAVIVTIKEDGAVVDVSSVTTKEIVFHKPNGTSVTKTASFTNTGSDGKIQYITESGFLDQVGFWRARGYVVFPDAFDGHSDDDRFQVKDNL